MAAMYTDEEAIDEKPAWLMDDRRDALRDFWRVYEDWYDEIQADTLREALEHPEFGPLIRGTPPEVAKEQGSAGRERLRSLLVDGKWAPYARSLRQQGAVYARLGISFQGWYDLAGAFSRHLVPHLVEAFLATPPRLCAALLAQQEFLDAAMATIAEAYLETKEADLRESEERLATTLDSIGDAVIATDTLGCIVRMNPVAERLTGWPLNDARGVPLAEIFRIFNEETGEPVESPVDRVLREGTIVGLANHTVLVARGGTRIPIADSGAPIRAASGEITGVVLVFRDQTAEQEAHAALRRWEEIFLHAGWGIALRSGDGLRNEAVNSAFAAMHGYTVQEALALPVSAFVSPASQEEFQALTRIVRESGHDTGECTHVRKDGTTFPVSVDATAVSAGHGGVRFIAINVQDISDRRRAEEIRARSAVLEAENRRVLEATRLKSEFLANMSHELRTPLNAIIGFTELIHDGEVTPDAPEYQAFIHDILASARHLLKLINDVLDLSKVEAGKLEFHPEDVHLSWTIGEIVAILRTTAAAKSIRVEATVDPEVDCVRVDAGRLKQVLYNYLSNALKFTPEHGIVSVRVAPEGEGDFRLEVEDTGIGIAPEDLPRLFVEFQQLDGGAGKKHGGTGLGLALTRRLVEAQGGSVGVRSVLGVGSVFHAVLPRQATLGRAMPQSRSVPGSKVGAPTVLVVEDNEREQSILVQALADAGYAVDTASTGAHARAMCERRAYDAITLDLLLPDVGGLEVLRDIRGGGPNERTPVIVITVVAERGAVVGFSVHDILAKPLDTPTLLASLRRAGVTPDRAGAVLVVDDDPGSLRLMAATLSQLGFRSNCVLGGEHGLRVAEATTPIAVVLDLLMPGLDGFQFLERFRCLEACRDVPVIIWTVKDLSAPEYYQLRSAAQGIVLKGRDGGAAVLEELRAVLQRPRTSG